jgi:selenocysteine lyase/cysteine desulfurase
LAEFFGLSDARGVVFTKNATEAINLAVAVYTQKGGRVLCDDMAHAALARPLYRLADEGRIRLSFYPHGAKGEALLSLFSPDTVLLCATHASNVCSHKADVVSLGQAAKARGVPFLVDASQSAGHLPVHMEKMGADVLCLPAHKGLFGMMGAGAALFARPEEEYPPFLLGGGGVHSHLRTMPRELPEHFEAGTLPLPAIAAMEAGVLWVKARGLTEIAGHIGRLEARLREGLANTAGVTLYGANEVGHGILSFTHARLFPEVLAARSDERGFAVRAGLHCAPLAHATLGTPEGGTVRLSLGATNTVAECERFLCALGEILKE